jgi:hypothetical protein
LGGIGGTAAWYQRELHRRRTVEWHPELIKAVGGIIRLRAECNTKLQTYGRKPFFRHGDDMYREVYRCMQLVTNEAEFGEIAKVLHWLLREGVDEEAWPAPDEWPSGEAIIITGEGQDPFIRQLSRLRNWMKAHIRSGKQMRQLGDIFEQWELSRSISDSDTWGEAQIRLMTEAVKFLTRLDKSLSTVLKR